MKFGRIHGLVPRNGSVLQVLVNTRVSKPAKGINVKQSHRPGQQDERSNKDQSVMLRRWLRAQYKGRIEFTFLPGCGSGERLDRRQTQKIRKLIRSRRFDLILVEDLGRILRRIQAYEICELAEDYETRIIAVNDNLDTAQDGWRLSAFFAAMRHEMYNADTARRIRRSQRGRFESGGMLGCMILGYIKPPDATSDDDLRKDPSAEPIYREMFERLQDGATYAEIADWLIEQGIPVGPHCRSKQWTGRIVARIVHNPILKGKRVWNNRMSRRVNSTGRRKSIKAPAEERLVRDCPHLAFFDEEYYDRVIAAVDERNKYYQSKGQDGEDTRRNVSRKRTRFPGQCIYCGICGRLFVFGGHGQTDRLMCQGAREHKCWNGVTVDGPLAAEKISVAVSAAIAEVPGFDDEYLQLLNDEVRQANEALDDSLKRLKVAFEQNEREFANVLAEIKRGNASLALREELRLLEESKKRLVDERQLAECDRVDEIVLPSADQIKQGYHDAFRGLATNSFVFARRLRRLVPRIVVLPVRLCTGGKIELRAKFRLKLSALLNDPRLRKHMSNSLERIVTIDVFEPSQPARFREQVVAMRSTGLAEREVAKHLRLTITATQAAASLQRAMDSWGLSDPYVLVTAPPEDYPKLSRHRHPRYRFDPLSDAGSI